MAYLTDVVNYDAGVYQLAVTDPVQGGPGGVSNAPLQNLANRTAYLKQHVDNLESGATIPPTVAPINSPAFTGSPTVPNVAAGDNSTKAVNSGFVQAAINGIATVNVAGNSNVTLTAAQYGVRSIILTGALTGNINVIFPAQGGNWLVENSTTGAFTITCKTATGTGVLVSQGNTNHIWCDATNILRASTDYVARDTTTGSAQLPVGSTAQRSSGAGQGAIRFNSDSSQFEGYNGSAWGSLGGATGGGSDTVFYLNGQTVNTSYSIPSGQNAISAGPITIASGQTVTIPTGSVWTIA